jgi:drug/metabolite transporter (DMT)-like permease
MSDTLRGVCYMFLATFLFAVMTVFVKFLAALPVVEVIFFRALFSIGFCIYWLHQANIAMFGHGKALLITRGLVGNIALGMNFYLIQTVPLATASTLIYLAPVCSTLLGMYLLREKVRSIQFLFFALSFCGIVVVQGFDPRISFWHLCFGIATSFMMGFAYNIVRKLSKTEHPLVIIFYFPLVSLPISGLWAMFYWVQPQGWEWFHLIMMSICSLVAQYFMTRSYQLAEIGTVSIVNFTGIIYAIALGFIIFGESFNLMTYFGMFLVTAGVALNVLFKHYWYKEQDEDTEKLKAGPDHA